MDESISDLRAYSDMSTQARLRLDAEAHLNKGSAPSTQGWALSANALEILYKLASTPDSAGEGLKLLHELQTHQVELDLQHEQLVANEREFAQELAHYKALYDFAPAGYFIIGRDGHIVESNRAGASLFGATPAELGGRSIASLVADASRPALGGLLDTLCMPDAGASCTVYVDAARAGDNDKNGSGARRLRITASMAPNSDAFLLLVSEYD